MITSVFIVATILVVLFIVEPVLKKKLYKRVVGVVALNRDGKTIETITSPAYIIRYCRSEKKEDIFENDLEEFFNKLEDGEYHTCTHAKYLYAIKHRDDVENVISLEKEYKNMFIEKLAIGKFENKIKKHLYYDVSFNIKRKR